MFVLRIRHVQGLWFECGPGVAEVLRSVIVVVGGYSQTMRLTLLLLTLRLRLGTSIVRSGEDSRTSDDIRPDWQYPHPSFLVPQRQSTASQALRECPSHQTSPAIALYRALLPDIPRRHWDDRFSDYRCDIVASLTCRVSNRLFDRPISLIGFVSLRRHFADSCLLRYISATYIHVFYTKM